jgi:phosphate transport system permease protein
MWGFFVLAPVMASFVQPALIATLGNVPLVGFLFAGPPFGVGIFTAAIVLAVMILPFIAATMRDVLTAVPPVLKEAAYGLGATKWEVVRSVSIPYTRVSLIGGIMLGLGRALGETMAVTFVIGNSQRLSASLFSPGTSIASTLANEFGEAADFHLSTLFALGFLLFVITFFVLAAAKLMIARAEKAKGL